MSLDLFIFSKVAGMQTEFLTEIMILITNIMSTKVLAIISLLLILFFSYKKKYKKCVLVVFAIGGGIILELSLKALIQRARPENALLEISSSYSFPSGHATMAMIFFSLLIYLFKDEIKNTILRYCFIAGNILLIILIGISRVYLNAHWLTDVLGGFVLGLLWLVFLILICKSTKERTKKFV